MALRRINATKMRNSLYHHQRPANAVSIYISAALAAIPYDQAR